MKNHPIFLLTFLLMPLSDLTAVEEAIKESTVAEVGEVKTDKGEAKTAKGKKEKKKRKRKKLGNGPKGKVYVYNEAAGQKGTMEIHFPENHDPSKPVPGIILFHGGGWSSGNSGSMNPFCNYFARRGMVAASVNYPFKNAEKEPVNQGKIICDRAGLRAIRWFKANAEELGVDPDRVIAGGGSAGGSICMHATNWKILTDPEDPHKDIAPTVVAYILFNPAIKETSLSYFEHPESLAPAIAFFGTADPRLAGYKKLQDELVARGAPKMEIWYAKDQGHAFYKLFPWPWHCLYHADRFLVSLGYLEGEPLQKLPEDGTFMTRNSDGNR